ncbi:MAG: conjugal transfer protein TraF [Spirochaetales bacterium]|nr:conjugal transfer protein TraF [Spirochaetales bacterium]
MKKIILLILIACIFTGFSFGQDILDDPIFAPVLPDVIGMGNAVTATAHGYEALFTNPAGFSKADGSFTLLSASVNPYFAPTAENIDNFELALTDQEAAIVLLSDLVVTNGIGANVNTGIAVVGKGLGLGIIVDVDSYARGNTPLGTDVDAVGTLAAVAGLSFNPHLGPLSIHIGGDLRYMHRMKMENVSVVDLMNLGDDDPATTADVNLLTGDALAIDLGAIIDMGPLSLGMSIRDVGGTKFIYSYENMDTNETGDVDADYRIPMQINTGIGYHPDFGALAFFIDPTFTMEYQHVFYQDPENTPSFWTGVHAGTEIRVLRFIKLRGGINQGYFTAGIGAKLLFLDINMAYFTREMSEYAGVDPNSGMSLEVAIRF